MLGFKSKKERWRKGVQTRESSGKVKYHMQFNASLSCSWHWAGSKSPEVRCHKEKCLHFLPRSNLSNFGFRAFSLRLFNLTGNLHKAMVLPCLPVKCVFEYVYKIYLSEMKWKLLSGVLPTPWDPMACIVHGIPQARILEWVAILFSRGSSQPRNRTQVSRIAGGFVTGWAARGT